MPKFAQIGDKFFTAGERGRLEEISERDILGLRGDVPGGATLDLIRREGDILNLQPGQLILGDEGRVLLDNRPFALGGSDVFIQNQAQAQALGIPNQLPAGQLPQSQALTLDALRGRQNIESLLAQNPQVAQALQSGQPLPGGAEAIARQQQLPSLEQLQAQQGQTLANVTGQPQAQGPQFDATIGQNPFQVGGQFGNRTFGRVGEQVFETTGGQRRPITEKEFLEQLKPQGLNLDVLPQLGPAPTGGQQEAEDTLARGATGTLRLPREQNDFFKSIQDRMARTDDLVSRILTSFSPSQAEKDIQQQLDALLNQQELQGIGFEMGVNEIMNQPIPQPLLVGQSEALQRQYLASERNTIRKIDALQRELGRLGDNREAQLRALTFAYDAQRQSVMDALNFWKATAPDQIAENLETGEIWLRNPITSQIYKAKLPGWTPPEERPDTSIVDVGRRKLLINTQTGQTIKDLGSSAGGLSGAPTGTQGQFIAANYASRIKQANDIFGNIESQISQMDPVTLSIQRRLPNALKNDAVRQYEQAERNFINAVLRRESGAAIAESEFENARKQYFVQPGDDSGTILQKQLNRSLVQQNFINEAGTAYVPGSLNVPGGQTSGQSGQLSPGTQVKKGNIIYQVEQDGVTLTPIASAQ